MHGPMNGSKTDLQMFSYLYRYTWIFQYFGSQAYKNEVWGAEYVTWHTRNGRVTGNERAAEYTSSA